MDDGVVQLSSKSHHENILGSLHQLRLQGQLSDVTVRVDYQGEAEEFPAHQVMLAASSGYFKRILLSQDAAPNKLVLLNMHTADFSTFLEFVYTGKAEVAKDKIGDVREVAAMLDCSDLSEVCSEALDAGQSEEPATETSSVDGEKSEPEGAESETMPPKTRMKRPPRRAARKRYLSPRSSKRGEGGPKRSKVRNAVEGGDEATTRGEEGGTTRLSSRLAGRKVVVRVLKRIGDEPATEGSEKNADTDTAIENTDEVEADVPLQTTDKISLGAPASEDEGDEPEETPEGDLEEPLYLSLEEEEEGEGDAQRMLKRVSKAQFECEKCQRTFHYERSYLKHISTYHGVKAEVVYRCETCMQTFKNRGNLKIHEKHVHSDERLFPCQVCTKTFKRKKDVIRHQRQVHEGGGQRHICPLCGKLLSSKTALLLHERTHTGAKPFECSICNAKFTQSSALKMHHRTHTGEKPFACDQCNARFTQKHMLSYHKRSHTGEKPFMCEACGKSFASKEYLRHHSNIHTGSRPYKCEQCGRGFAQRNSLHQHLKIHTGERPYSCKECDKQFTQLNALQRHQRIHTGEKPYMCGLCNRTFTDKSTVRRHTMTHDTDAPWKNYLVVLDGNIEEKKPQDSPKETAEKKTSAGESMSSAGGDGAGGDGAGGGSSTDVSGGSSAQTMVVPAEQVTLSANWASHTLSHSGLGGIIVIHSEVPPGTQFQPIMTTDGTGANVISLDGSAISVPFSIPVSMAHPLPVSSAAAAAVMSSPSLSVPVSETMLASVSESPAASSASVLEAAVSQTIFAPVPEADMLGTDIQTVIISEKDCVVEQPATTDEQQRTAEQIHSEETSEEVPTENAE